MKRVSFVTPIGFKPITAGAEIQCAIQLRHGAFFLASGAHPFSRLRHGAFFFGEWCKSFLQDCATEP